MVAKIILNNKAINEDTALTLPNAMSKDLKDVSFVGKSGSVCITEQGHPHCLSVISERARSSLISVCDIRVSKVIYSIGSLSNIRVSKVILSTY